MKKYLLLLASIMILSCKNGPQGGGATVTCSLNPLATTNGSKFNVHNLSIGELVVVNLETNKIYPICDAKALNLAIDEKDGAQLQEQKFKSEFGFDFDAALKNDTALQAAIKARVKNATVIRLNNTKTQTVYGGASLVANCADSIKKRIAFEFSNCNKCVLAFIQGMQLADTCYLGFEKSGNVNAQGKIQIADLGVELTYDCSELKKMVGVKNGVLYDERYLSFDTATREIRPTNEQYDMSVCSVEPSRYSPFLSDVMDKKPLVTVLADKSERGSQTPVVKVPNKILFGDSVFARNKAIYTSTTLMPASERTMSETHVAEIWAKYKELNPQTKTWENFIFEDHSQKEYYIKIPKSEVKTIATRNTDASIFIDSKSNLYLKIRGALNE